MGFPHICAGTVTGNHLDRSPRWRANACQVGNWVGGLVMKVILAQPRGFCAGVVRAIEIVERALERYGAPVYVRHEIVHNRHVVESLKAKGALFVEDLSEVPTGAVTIFQRARRLTRRRDGCRGAKLVCARCRLPARRQGPP